MDNRHQDNDHEHLVVMATAIGNDPVTDHL